MDEELNLSAIEVDARIMNGMSRRQRAQVYVSANWFVRLGHRDGFVCFYCLVELRKDIATRDHVMPKSRGGRSHDGNLRLSCKRCNMLKGDKVPDAWTRGCRAPDYRLRRDRAARALINL